MEIETNGRSHRVVGVKNELRRKEKVSERSAKASKGFKIETRRETHRDSTSSVRKRLSGLNVLESSVISPHLSDCLERQRRGKRRTSANRDEDDASLNEGE